MPPFSSSELQIASCFMNSVCRVTCLLREIPQVGKLGDLEEQEGPAVSIEVDVIDFFL